jgi:glycosyltransferase involved in cell wall biosynthesis
MPESVLLVHNRYLERGGEDSAFETEAALLEAFGHRVLLYERDNREIASLNQAHVALRTVWSRQDYREIADLVRREQIDVVHFHNTFPLISPAAHHAARHAGAAVVQTLHNFRLLCPAAVFMRDGAACEDCLGKSVPWPAIAHRCYRGSAAATTVLAGMLTTHRVVGTWRTQVDAFIALSDFARDRFIAGGLPADRVHVSGGVLAERVAPPARYEAAAGAPFLYVGRLSAEKGVETLLAGWSSLQADWRLDIIGDGPLGHLVGAAVGRDPRIRWHRALPREQVLGAMGGARALIFPSICYENYPAVLAEAQASGLPVIASDLGSGGEIVRNGEFGVLFDAGKGDALAAAVLAFDADAAARSRFSECAYTRYLAELTPERWHSRLASIYERALQVRGSKSRPTALTPTHRAEL